jgi:putative ABC transport system substrate-binding protein
MRHETIGNSNIAKVGGFVLCTLLFALCVSAEAQQPEKTRWIGYLTGSGSAPNQAFIQGLRELLGYVQGKNIGFVYRSAEGTQERFADLATELVRLKVDIIVADVTSAVVAAKKATTTIPIVMTSITDPVGTGLVTSLARPGGNITGLTNITAELGGKFLELLKEIVPKLNRVAILFAPSVMSATNEVFIKETEVSARGSWAVRVRGVVVGMRRKHSLYFHEKP